MNTSTKPSTQPSRYSLREKGASLVEYALLIGFVATIGIISIRFLGQSMSSQFSTTSAILQGG